MLENLKTLFNENSVKFEELSDEIIIVEDFLTDEEFLFIMDKINAATQEDWEIEYTSNLKNFCMTKFGRDDVENLVAEGKFEITQGWTDKNLNLSGMREVAGFHGRLEALVRKADPTLEVSGLATIQRMQPGVELKAHIDQKTDPSIRYATIIYLNDDYNKGSFSFSNLDLGEIRPKPKSLLIFPGDQKHEHGVDFVADGPIRYVVVGFIKEIGHYERNKY
jgi:hypothetical protein